VLLESTGKIQRNEEGVFFSKEKHINTITVI